MRLTLTKREVIDLFLVANPNITLPIDAINISDAFGVGVNNYQPTSDAADAADDIELYSKLRTSELVTLSGVEDVWVLANKLHGRTATNLNINTVEGIFDDVLESSDPESVLAFKRIVSDPEFVEFAKLWQRIHAKIQKKH